MLLFSFFLSLRSTLVASRPFPRAPSILPLFLPYFSCIFHRYVWTAWRTTCLTETYIRQMCKTVSATMSRSMILTCGCYSEVQELEKGDEDRGKSQ